MKTRILALGIVFALCTACTSSPPSIATANDETANNFGVLVMAHGGSDEWDQGVLETVAPLRENYPLEVAFGMADAVSLQQAVDGLEARGVTEIAVIRLFISGESWYERTEQILGLSPGAPPRPMPSAHSEDHGSAGMGHSMEFWQLDSEAEFAMSEEGLAEAEEMDEVLRDRVGALSSNPEAEDVLILAHGPADDEENERWIDYIGERADLIRSSAPFRRVEVQTLREDWEEKREGAERRVRDFVGNASATDGRAIVVPFRVHGFGPYAQVLEGLDYASDGRGLIPHPAVTRWLSRQIERVRDEL